MRRDRSSSVAAVALIRARRAFAAASALACIALVGCTGTGTGTGNGAAVRPAGLDTERSRVATQLLDDAVAAQQVAGASCMVWLGDECVLQHAVGYADLASKRPLQPDAIVRIYSMSKPITAVAALVLVERGVLRLDQPIRELLPELAAPQVFVGGTAEAPQLAPAATPITVRMLLNHTAGFTYDFFRDSPLHEMYRGADLWSSATSEQFLQRIAALPLLAQPGTAWNYSVADDVLGVLIERASGEPLDDFVRRNVTAPLGMHDTDYDVPADKLPRLASLHRRQQQGLAVAPVSFGAWAEAGRGFAAGGAGMFSTLRDYGTFARWLLGDGSHRGQRVLSRKMMELLRTDSLRAPMRADSGDGWGLVSAVVQRRGLGSELMSEGTLYWSGAATTMFSADPAEQLVIVLFAQHFPFDEPKLLRRFRTAVYQALR